MGGRKAVGDIAEEECCTIGGVIATDPAWVGYAGYILPELAADLKDTCP